ncbi:NAD(P)/FAD-dependent oxidoreductase [Neptunomonas antarctica]|uniref:Amine oxidase domain-containing protein n=2 Tax=Neptunomonas antarctica TaxID=619304 RepID=A0A1N7IWN7_9GAMM|nr:FAD-dependent oxidoreductase [Neptunomonas antarctica]SIS41513.1 hypothetical protein SAMN05421760_101242 [Neptunomonas antarctica]
MSDRIEQKEHLDLIMQHSKPLKIAVIGSGISGLSCAWLLSRQDQVAVTLFEKDDRRGGHSNTVEVDTAQGPVPVDTGFIVFNPKNYPNLVELFKYLKVPVKPTEMSFGISLDNGKMEYSGSGLQGLFAQPGNLLRPRFINMVLDILRFYKETSSADFFLDEHITLRQFIQEGGYGDAFRDEHLLPMGAAIWSTPADKMLDYPASAFLRFCANHGLLQINDRPQWHTVTGGSREYVQRLCDDIDGSIHKVSNSTILTDRAVRHVRRIGGKAIITDWQGDTWKFDHVVFACHADQTLKLLADARADETDVLKHFHFERNRAVLHSDTALMPQRKKVWSSWNYMGETTHQGRKLSVSYWMNSLQHLTTDQTMIVTLNPFKEPAEGTVHASFLYDHPVFDLHTTQAQKRLWDIQGQNNTWFCGAWCGYGFHEDGLQSGLAVAEALGGMKRPWNVPDMYSRLPLPEGWLERFENQGAAA